MRLLYQNKIAMGVLLCVGNNYNNSLVFSLYTQPVVSQYIWNEHSARTFDIISWRFSYYARK